MMHPTQLAYTIAKATHECLAADADGRFPCPANDCPETEFDAWEAAYEDYLDAIGYWTASDELKSASDAMLVWARDAIAAQYPESVAQTAPVYAAALKHRQPWRNQMVAVCARLDPASV